MKNLIRVSSFLIPVLVCFFIFSTNSFGIVIPDECDAGYTGPNCDECAIGYQDNDGDGICLPNCDTSGLDCGDHGSCNDASGEAVCECDAGYTGPYCESGFAPPLYPDDGDSVNGLYISPNGLRLKRLTNMGSFVNIETILAEGKVRARLAVWVDEYPLTFSFVRKKNQITVVCFINDVGNLIIERYNNFNELIRTTEWVKVVEQPQ